MISVIISHYKKVENLHLILQGLNRQSYKDFEVIVSEDGSDPSTMEFLKNSEGKWNFPLWHLTQEDKGFRKNKILNASVRKSNGSFLVFIDGDCIPHRHFVKEYFKVAEDHGIFYGRRVFLSSSLSSKLKSNMVFKGVSFLQLLFSGSEKLKEHFYSPSIRLSFATRGLKGCNWGVQKEDLMKVNGFDEDYVYATVGEDDDIAWRLKRIGLSPISMKNKAIVYHLDHPRSYSMEGTKINVELMESKQKNDQYFCINGIGVD